MSSNDDILKYLGNMKAEAKSNNDALRRDVNDKLKNFKRENQQC